MEKLGINNSELDGIASIPIKIEGVDIGITIKEVKPSENKISVRTSANVDANKFCQHFGGGGHARAGGFKLSGSTESAKNEILDAIKEFLKW